LLDSYRGKTVLVTGHTGFKGSWLSIWLNTLGARVVGLSNNVPTTPSNFEASQVAEIVDDRRLDVRDAESVQRVFDEVNPDYVFHLAAQALVRKSYAAPLETFAINGMGTANVLEAIRVLNRPVTVVMITSDKVYDNVDWVWGYRETDRIGGKDPYSGSKGVAELVIRSYLASFFSAALPVRLGVVRAGNVIGGGDWAADRVVPDCIRAWSLQRTVEIRNPHATRPWQHVLEPLSGYLALGAELSERGVCHGQAYNFGPSGSQNHSVGRLIEAMSQLWKGVTWADVSTHQHVHEASLLKLNCDKALAELAWKPAMRFDETIRFTVDWYKAYYEQGTSTMREFTRAQIAEYTELANRRGIAWAQNR